MSEPTENAMKVIIAVVESIDRTEEEWNKFGEPPVWKYAVDARSALRDMLVTLEDYNP